MMDGIRSIALNTPLSSIERVIFVRGDGEEQRVKRAEVELLPAESGDVTFVTSQASLVQNVHELERLICSF